jgi:hypothetical protein
VSSLKFKPNWHYFKPKNGNPYVIAFYLSIFTARLFGAYWLFANDDAEMPKRHPGIFLSDFSSPTKVKLFWALRTTAKSRRVLHRVFDST